MFHEGDRRPSVLPFNVESQLSVGIVVDGSNPEGREDGRKDRHGTQKCGSPRGERRYRANQGVLICHGTFSPQTSYKAEMILLDPFLSKWADSTESRERAQWATTKYVTAFEMNVHGWKEADGARARDRGDHFDQENVGQGGKYGPDQNHVQERSAVFKIVSSQVHK